MAAKRKLFRTPRRRSSTKRRRTRRRLRLPKHVVPDSKIVRLRYVTTVARDPGSGAALSYIFRANSLFDPDFTSIGHQPLGYDQWAQFYDHYTVLGSKMKVTFLSQSADPKLGTAICGILLKDNGTPLTNPEHIMEATNSGWKILTNATASQKITVTKNFSSRKFFGLKDVSDNRDEVGAGVTTNPSEDAYFHCFVAPTQADQNLPAITLICEIDFLAKFTERKTLAQS